MNPEHEAMWRKGTDMSDSQAEAIATLNALAERCEAAEGPDRELDRDIAICVRGLVSVFLFEGGGTYFNGIRNLDWFNNETLGPIPADEREDMGAFEGWSNFQIPPFTASLDAVMTLFEGLPSPTIIDALSEAFEAWVSSGARLRNWPRFVCAAALRARATQGNPHE